MAQQPESFRPFRAACGDHAREAAAIGRLRAAPRERCDWLQARSGGVVAPGFSRPCPASLAIRSSASPFRGKRRDHIGAKLQGLLDGETFRAEIGRPIFLNWRNRCPSPNAAELSIGRASRAGCGGTADAGRSKGHGTGNGHAPSMTKRRERCCSPVRACGRNRSTG